ncbi:hypothetical protein [Ectothiorhodospira lacustris]|uniref:hypothetical protein n=1 Tax=Ectothiorhodospira lacustris TaxID=2899127 RepID=UPI001EE877E8|nr:hypothetical protein [Ectothiorhodospira lacustris]MCG5500271.1 hypothetical protein [Ectothiorhodospira lacustris]
MPLTSVVDYLNSSLQQLHPQARLRDLSQLSFDHGRLSAQIAGFQLQPYQVPVATLVEPPERIIGRSGQFRLTGVNGRHARPESIYVHAWDSHDVVFLDRFLRTMHALFHISQEHSPEELLVLPVHLRHVSALSERHGQVFEGLLSQLGLSPRQVVLRLQGRALQDDPHVQQAAQSFITCGYRLAAVLNSGPHNDPATIRWPVLRNSGISWISPDQALLQHWQEQDGFDLWRDAAKVHGIGLWLTGIDSAATPPRSALAAEDILEGDRFLVAANGQRLDPGHSDRDMPGNAARSLSTYR